MTRDKILYVDDEAMALKYFDRLVSPLAPVITALSVAEGKAGLSSAERRLRCWYRTNACPGRTATNCCAMHANTTRPWCGC